MFADLGFMSTLQWICAAFYATNQLFVLKRSIKKYLELIQKQKFDIIN